MKRFGAKISAVNPASRRGFLLLIVVGLLAVMLTLAVGFISYTRTETQAVSTIRDKVDGMMLMHSAMDWMIANISNDIFDGNNQPLAGNSDTPSGVVSSVLNPNDPCYKWWYKSIEPGYSPWNAGAPNGPYTYSNMQAQWVDIPASYFPTGGIKGQFSVQVLDANAYINLNDWLDDCNPTQCQMSHMLMDSVGDTYLENYYGWRDSGQWSGTAFNAAPLRYDHAWKMATQTRRSTVYPNNTGLAQVTDTVSPNWVTHNSTWTTLQGLDIMCARTEISSKGLPMRDQQVWQGLGPKNYYPPTRREGFVPGMFSWGWDFWGAWGNNYPDYCGYWNLTGNWWVGKLPTTFCYSLHGNSDPDTGRSAVNVNTCLRSGEQIPNNAQFTVPSAYTIESVFNVESLRRIVKIGDFYFTDSKKNQRLCNAADPLNPNYITNLGVIDKALAWQKHEQLRLKAAYQYQETLCRYFTADYEHPNLQFDNGAQALARRNPPFKGGPGTYTAVYGGNGVKWCCQSNNYNTTRFPVGVQTFRSHCFDDFKAMSTAMPAAIAFDTFDKCSIKQGFLDARTANAVYDNIVPGKALIWKSTYKTGVPASNDFLDPLQELYDIQLGRDESTDDPYNTQATSSNNAGPYWTDNGAMSDSGLTAVTGIPAKTTPIPSGRNTLRCKGQDIALSTAPEGWYARQYTDAGGAPKNITRVPWRQLCFGPDWFSTELTTSSTTFYLIITVRTQDTALNQDIFVGQWGAVAELSPDIMTETPKNFDSSYTGATPWPKGDPGKPETMGLGFYRGGWPKLLKSAKAADPYAQQYSMDAFPDNTIKSYRSESASQGTQWTTTSTDNWADFRGTTNNLNMNTDPLYCGNFYQDQNPADPKRSQTKKQVRIKAIWSLSGGTY